MSGRPVLQHAEYLEAALAFKKTEDSAAAWAKLRTFGDFTEELVTVSIPPDESSAAGEAFILVAPRYFRGLALDEEYGAFLDYAALVERAADSILGRSGLRVKVLPLHPKHSDFSRQAPHPALLFLK